MIRIQHSSMGVACGLALLIAACGEPTGNNATSTLRPHLETVAAGPALIACPTDVTLSARETIGAQGGTLAVSGARLTLPAGAVLEPTTFTLTVPASAYLEIEISADGADSFQFERPAEVEIKYSRCAPNNTDTGVLSAWYIDSNTKALLQNMDGTDDKSKRAVIFSTGHLSGYAIAQ